ncbi:MAG: hypothetical protein PHP12_00295 [Bacilli bacterium]|nr:hypothetical protein [Bacilli bacterium]
MEFTKQEQDNLNTKLALTLIRMLYNKNLISKEEFDKAIEEANRILKDA